MFSTHACWTTYNHLKIDCCLFGGSMCFGAKMFLSQNFAMLKIIIRASNVNHSTILEFFFLRIGWCFKNSKKIFSLSYEATAKQKKRSFVFILNKSSAGHYVYAMSWKRPPKISCSHLFVSGNELFTCRKMLCQKSLFKSVQNEE